MEQDVWEPWLGELERATAAGDTTKVDAILENLWRFRFREHRNSHHDRWDRLFELLLVHLGSADWGLRKSALHYVEIAMGAEYGPPYEDHSEADRRDVVIRRTMQLLPAVTPGVGAGHFSLLDCVDRLVHIEGMAELGPQQAVEHWIESLAGGSPLELAARIAYVEGRGPWEHDGSSLVELLSAAAIRGEKASSSASSSIRAPAAIRARAMAALRAW